MLDFKHYKVHINICDIIAFINLITRQNTNVKQIIRTYKIFTIQSYITTKILIIYYNNLLDCNFLFESQYIIYLNQDKDVFAHIINASLFFVQIHNVIVNIVMLSRKTKLEIAIKYN